MPIVQGVITEMPDSGTSEEIIQLVDKNDKVIGTIPISQANSDPTKFHREVGIIIVDSQRRMLLQQRAFTKKHDPGKWTVAAAGHIPVGMTPEEAAHMELQEELGFDTELTFFEKVFHQIPTQSRFFYNYLGRVDSPQITIEPAEVAQAGFYSETEALKLLGEEPEGLSLQIARRFFAGELDGFLQSKKSS